MYNAAVPNEAQVFGFNMYEYIAGRSLLCSNSETAAKF